MRDHVLGAGDGDRHRRIRRRELHRVRQQVDQRLDDAIGIDHHRPDVRRHA